MHFPCQIFVESDFPTTTTTATHHVQKLGLSLFHVSFQGHSFGGKAAASAQAFIQHTHVTLRFSTTILTPPGRDMDSSRVSQLQSCEISSLGLSPSQKELSLHYQEHQLIINAASHSRVLKWNMNADAALREEQKQREGRTRSLFIVHLGSMEGMTKITPRMTQCVLCVVS